MKNNITGQDLIAIFGTNDLNEIKGRDKGAEPLAINNIPFYWTFLERCMPTTEQILEQIEEIKKEIEKEPLSISQRFFRKHAVDFCDFKWCEWNMQFHFASLYNQYQVDRNFFLRSVKEDYNRLSNILKTDDPVEMQKRLKRLNATIDGYDIVKEIKTMCEIIEEQKKQKGD